MFPMTKAARKDRTTAGSDDSDQVKPSRSPEAARWTLLVLTVISLALLTRIVQPFAAALFIAAVIAGAISPWYERLAARSRRRSWPSFPRARTTSRTSLSNREGARPPPWAAC
jgi:hypothetical protein